MSDGFFKFTMLWLLTSELFWGKERWIIPGTWTSLNWLCWMGFRPETISGKDRAAQKTVVYVISCHKWHKNNHLATITRVQSQFLIHSVALPSKHGKKVDIMLLNLYCFFQEREKTAFIWASLHWDIHLRVYPTYNNTPQTKDNDDH